MLKIDAYRVENNVLFTRFYRPKGKSLKCDPTKGRTQQGFKEECDINSIVERYTKTGLWGNSMKAPTEMPIFGDFTSVPDFVESHRIIAEANELFDALPAAIRKKFNNDPAALLAFVSDEGNRAEAEKLGIVRMPETAPVAESLPKETPKEDGKK